MWPTSTLDCMYAHVEIKTFPGSMPQTPLVRSALSALRQRVDRDVHNILSIAAINSLRRLCYEAAKHSSFMNLQGQLTEFHYSLLGLRSLLLVHHLFIIFINCYFCFFKSVYYNSTVYWTVQFVGIGISHRHLHYHNY